LQCVAVCCSVLQGHKQGVSSIAVQCVAGVLRCIAVCCDVLQSVC